MLSSGESTTLHICIWLSGLFQIFQRKYPPIFWACPFLRRCISPTWSPHHLLLTRLMPSSSTTILHHRISQKFFANGMKSIGMHLTPHGAQLLRDHPICVNNIFSSICSHWFVKHIVVIYIPSWLSHSITHFFSILHLQYCLTTLAPGAYLFSIGSTYTAYMLSVCWPYLSIVLGVYRSHPNLNAWHLFCFSPHPHTHGVMCGTPSWDH